jgi:hypothetical protein
MSRTKTLFMALFTVFILAAALGATSAFAELPDVHVGAGLTYPVTSTGTLENGGNIVGELETEIGEKLTSTKVTVATELTKLTSLGPLTLKFNSVLEPRTKSECHSDGVGAGEVVFSGEYHVVYTTLSPVTVLNAGFLILFNEDTVLCNKEALRIKVKAPALTRLNVAAGAEVEEFRLVALCTPAAKQEPKEYFNEEAKPVIANFLSNFGAGFEKTCIRLSKELKVKTSKKVDFLF